MERSHPLVRLTANKWLFCVHVHMGGLSRSGAVVSLRSLFTLLFLLAHLKSLFFSIHYF